MSKPTDNPRDTIDVTFKIGEKLEPLKLDTEQALRTLYYTDSKERSVQKLMLSLVCTQSHRISDYIFIGVAVLHFYTNKGFF